MSTDPKKNNEIRDEDLDKVSGGAGITAAEVDPNSTETASIPPPGPSRDQPTPEQF